MAELMAIKPREILGVEPVALAAGNVADLTIVDPKMSWTVSTEDFESRSHNSGFIGWEITGRPTDVYVGGEATMIDCRVVD